MLGFKYWLDGLPLESDSTSGYKYWSDGLPFEFAGGPTPPEPGATAAGNNPIRLGLGLGL
jgi:hypothetical protein